MLALIGFQEHGEPPADAKGIAPFLFWSSQKLVDTKTQKVLENSKGSWRPFWFNFQRMDFWNMRFWQKPCFCLSQHISSSTLPASLPVLLADNNSLQKCHVSFLLQRNVLKINLFSCYFIDVFFLFSCLLCVWECIINSEGFFWACQRYTSRKDLIALVQIFLRKTEGRWLKTPLEANWSEPQRGSMLGFC